MATKQANVKILFMLALVLICVFGVLACRLNRESVLGIYLADTGELVLSDQEISAYRDGAFELTEQGVTKWNSFHVTGADIPSLAASLYQRDFVMKIDEREICRGKFWSNLSSASYSGMVILDAVMPLDSSRNVLQIRSGYPAAGESSLEAPVFAELANYFGQLK